MDDFGAPMQKVRRRVAQSVGRGATRVRLDPGDGNVMMGADLLKKATDVLNENLISTRLDGVITEKSNAVLTVSDEQAWRRSRPRCGST